MSGAERAPVTRNRFDRHPVLTGIAIALALVLVLDIIVGTYLNRRSRALLRIGRANERSYRRADSVYHHDLVPLMRVDSALWGGAFYRVRTNSLGFKDADPRIVTPASVSPRVVIIGDSFTEGIGVVFDSTTVGRFATRGRGVGVDVLNAGVASYSPVIYYRKMRDLLERRRLRVDEVVVFIDISDIQDEAYLDLDANGRVKGYVPGTRDNHLEMPGTEADSGSLYFRVRRFLGANSFAVYRALSVVTHPMRHRNKVRSTVDGAAYPGPSCDPPPTGDNLRCRAGWTSSAIIMNKFGRTGLARGAAHMSQLAALLRQRGIPMTVVVYPWIYQLQWNDRHSIQSSTWRAWAEGQQVGFVDLFPAFFSQVDSTSVDAVTTRLFLNGDVHWNVRGHDFVAQQFAASYCAAHGNQPTVRTPLALAICAVSR